VLVAGAGVYLVANVDNISDGIERTRDEADAYNTLPDAIAKAGGIAAFRRCHVYTGHFQVPAVAWYLKLHTGQVGIDPKPPGIVIAPRNLAEARDRRFDLLTTTRRWVVRQACDA
jgi:hypothetical protein